MIKSPCVHYCVVKNDVCPACGRSMDEVVNWPTMTDEEKKQVIENAKKRVEELKAKGQFVDYF